MKLAMIGLGKMGANMTRRMGRDGEVGAGRGPPVPMAGQSRDHLARGNPP